MREAIVSSSSHPEDFLDDDILQHVTPKWVDWYRDNARRQPGEQDQERSEAVKAPAKSAARDSER